MPFKANAHRRHHIPKQRRRITNWAEYDAALRQRGSLTVWFTREAIAAWHAEPRTTPGGQPHDSALAITTALTLKAVVRLALRQTEGLLGLDFSVPDHTTLSRRAETLEVPRPRSDSDAEPVHLLVDSTGLKVYGAGERPVEKHGERGKRTWRKPHLAIDPSADPWRTRGTPVAGERRDRSEPMAPWASRQSPQEYGCGGACGEAGADRLGGSEERTGLRAPNGISRRMIK